MEWLNYHHLFYFWRVARVGSLSGASAELRLAPSTVSGQLRSLESACGEPLFARRGRSLVLTELGSVVYRYAEQIFALGSELQETLKGSTAASRPTTLMVGIADVVPKLIALRLLEPALRVDDAVQLVCREDKPERLLSELAIHNLDVVLADAPAPPSVRVQAFSHLLGESGVVFLATPALARKYRKGFPESLAEAPMVLPAEGTALRRSLDRWFIGLGIKPMVKGEFDDAALLKVFGQVGMGIFPVSEVIAKEVERQYQVKPVGRAEGVSEQFFAITVHRKLKHPAVIALSEAARKHIFG